MADTLSYILRYVFWNNPTIRDYRKFSSAKVMNGNSVYIFNRDASASFKKTDLFRSFEYSYREETKKSSFNDFLKSMGTTSFIIVKDDIVLYEEYFNNYNRESVNAAFSISKSFTSALAGIAIDEGYINSVNDRVIDYLPELRGHVSDSLLLRHLITMSSGLSYSTSHYPWADEPKSYYYPDIQGLVIRSARQEYEPGRYFKYVNYNMILLGIVLERSTRCSPFLYLQEKIWKPIGMEFPAFWNIDSKKAGFPKMESGINARSIDFLKFGRLFLSHGGWENNQVISEKWVKESTSPLSQPDSEYYINKNFYPYTMFFKDIRLYYKYGWWGLKYDEEHYDFMAIGVLGQFIYVCPQKQLVIVRNGKQWGKINWWPQVFKKIADSL